MLPSGGASVRSAGVASAVRRRCGGGVGGAVALLATRQVLRRRRRSLGTAAVDPAPPSAPRQLARV